MSSLIAELRGWDEMKGMSDDGRRKVWLMHTAAEKLERLEMCGANAIGGLRACLVNPQLTPEQRSVAEEALSMLFDEQERWFAGPGRDPETR